MHISRRYYRTLRLVCFSFIFPLCTPAISQFSPEHDTVLRVDPGTFIKIRDSLSFFLNDTLIRIPTSIIPASNIRQDKTVIYYDSLREKASRKQLTKKLYDLVVVSPHSVESKNISSKSDEGYISYSGQKIRNIKYITLDVFGTNIDNPAAYSTKPANNILNRTHVNTNEKIIKKNMLVSPGDTVSPLTLSDNERILRELPFIHDARIIVVPASEEEVDLLVVTKDVYSLGAGYDYGGLKKGALSVFEKNIIGSGHEFGIKIPFNSDLPDSPGIGGHYTAINIFRSFINTTVDYQYGLGITSYGISLNRSFVSAFTKYAGGVLVRQTFTSTSLDTLPQPAPLKYNLQDYWLARSFLFNRESVSRIIIGARYLNNNVFKKPDILPKTYYSLQRYQLYLASAALSVQKYYKTNLIYGYGRTEDIPYGGLLRFTAGREFNEFKIRNYFGADISFGKSFPVLGYLYSSVTAASFFNGSQRGGGRCPADP